MKPITTLSILALSCLSANASYTITKDATGEEIKFGLEALTTWRSEYNYRGFQLADQSLEFQIAGQVALSDTQTIDIGIYHGSATGDGDFKETAAYIDFSKNIGDLTYTAKLAFKDFSDSIFDSGVDIGGSVNWVYNDTIDFTALLTYDTGAEGFYGEIKASAYKGLSLDSYLTFDIGLGITADYYDRSGLHQYFAKLSYTYNINESVSVSPYVGTSLGIDDEAQDSLYSGFYFAVSF